MQKKILLLLSIITIQAYATPVKPQSTHHKIAPGNLVPSTREIIIICDCGTESMERLAKNFEAEIAAGTAMIKTLQEALTESAAPILVTGQLMDFLVSCKDQAPELLKVTKSEQEANFYKECTFLNLDAFEIRRIDNTIQETSGVLYLIIPKSYLVKHGSKDAQVGLHISKFASVTEKDIRSKKTPENKNCSSYLVRQLPNIFVTLPKASYTSEGYTASTQYPYVWAIVLNGHGSFSASANIQLQEALAKKQVFTAELKKISQKIDTIDAQLKTIKNDIDQLPQKAAAIQAKMSSLPLPQQKKEIADFSFYQKTLHEKHSSLVSEINSLHKIESPLKLKVKLLDQLLPNIANSSTVAGMNMSDFRNFIQFLNNRIITSILVYISCSAGGQNFVDPYKEITSDNILDLKFTVVTSSTTEAVVTLHSTVQTSSTGEVTKSGDFGSYKAFFNAMHTPQDSLEKIVSLLIQIPHKTSGDITNFSLLPSIRTPHSSWVTVPTDNKNMFLLTKTKALAQGTTPLVIKDKQVVLIAPQEILFDLSMPSDKFPAIISQHAGISYHYFNKITTQASFITVAKGFLPVEMKSSKLFYIKELICASGTYTDVMFFINTPLQTAESIIISQQESYIDFKIQPVSLSNGIIYTQNKTQIMGQVWNSPQAIHDMVKTFEAAPLAEAQKIKSAIFAYFNMPAAPSEALVAQKKTLTTVLEKQQKGILPPAQYLVAATDQKPSITITAKTDQIISQLAESLHLLAHYSATK